jgi:hypothetical protein
MLPMLLKAKAMLYVPKTDKPCISIICASIRFPLLKKLRRIPKQNAKKGYQIFVLSKKKLETSQKIHA